MTDQPTWYCVHTKANAEKLVCDALRRKGFVAYLPAATVRVRHARRSHVVARPLFHRYAFVGLDPVYPPFSEVRKTWGVNWLVENVKQPVVVRTGLIDALRAAEADGAFDETRPEATPPYVKGEKVEITDGPFKGLVAEILALPSERRIDVIFRHAGLHVTMPLAMLKKAS